MKRVLILCYYWPPAGGPGVQRWVRFCNALAQYGWEPVIYTAHEEQYAMRDESLTAQVSHIRTLRLRSPEPYLWFQRLFRLGRREAQQGYRLHSGKASWKNKVGWFIRGNFFIPDARCLWIGPSTRWLSHILAQERFDALVSTGPPHSLHLTAARLSKRFSIPWVADFRDPWTSMGYYREMPLTAIANRIHQKLESKCVLEPHGLVVVGRGVQREFEARYGRRAEIIHNGYDSFQPIQKMKLDEKFTIVHIGAFLPRRNCEELWRTLARLKGTVDGFAQLLEIKLIGNTHESVVESAQRHGLGNELTLISYIPFHETQAHLLGAQILLLAVSKMDNAQYIIPGKLFEYLKARRPILFIGPTDGDSAEIIRRCEAGNTVNFNDDDTLEKNIKRYFSKYLCNENYIQSQHIEEFSSVHLTQKLVQLLDRVSSSH